MDLYTALTKEELSLALRFQRGTPQANLACRMLRAKQVENFKTGEKIKETLIKFFSLKIEERGFLGKRPGVIVCLFWGKDNKGYISGHIKIVATKKGNIRFLIASN